MGVGISDQEFLQRKANYVRGMADVVAAEMGHDVDDNTSINSANGLDDNGLHSIHDNLQKLFEEE